MEIEEIEEEQFLIGISNILVEAIWVEDSKVNVLVEDAEININEEEEI